MYCKYAIVDYRINKKSVNTLTKCKISVIYTKPIDILYDAVKGHTDMQIHYVGNKRFVCAAECYDYYRNQLPPEYEIICGKKPLQNKYPHDVLYNAAVIGDFAVCNKQYTSDEILLEYQDKTILNVKQGYAKCSTAVISKNAAITADNSIYKVLKKNGIDVLKIQPGSILLNGVSYGFIGGVCGLIASDCLAVNGNLSLHPDVDKIHHFCKQHGVNILQLNNEELYDVGSIVTF